MQRVIDLRRLDYMQEVCNQISQVSATVRETIRSVGKHEALNSRSLTQSTPYPALFVEHQTIQNHSVKRQLISKRESNHLMKKLNQAQRKIARLEEELSRARESLARRAYVRCSPVPSPVDRTPRDGTNMQAFFKQADARMNDK